MKLSYDTRYNIAYIRLREGPAEVETIRLSDQVNVDLAPDGTLHGIELLNANHQLGAGDAATLRIINEATGQSSETPLPA